MNIYEFVGTENKFDLPKKRLRYNIYKNYFRLRSIIISRKRLTLDSNEPGSVL